MILPAAALAQHIAVLGKTGSGKTFAVKGIVEQLLSDGRRVGIVDPTGAWWGLRSSNDGRGPGFPILVLGGDHGDLPLPALGGAAVARLLVEQNVNLVADTSHLSVGERTRWFIDFAHTLYRLNKTPLHLVIDEAHNFAPQGKVPDPDTGKMLHAANTLASGGRSRGIRLAMITQRPAKLHKDSLTCADTLIAMRVLAPQDREAVEAWVMGCGSKVHGKMVLDSLASLQRGEGWIWYPEGSFLERSKFPAIRTFDSSATPTDGHAVATPRGAAEIDLSEIKGALQEAVKEAEANDPRLLKKRIAELEKRPYEMDVTVIRRAEQDGYARGRREALEGALRASRKVYAEAQALGQLQGAIAGLKVEAEVLVGALETELQAAPAPAPSVKHTDQFANRGNFAGPPPVKHPAQIHASTPAVKSGINGSLDRAQRAFLTVLAQRARPVTRNQVAIFSGYSATSRHVDNVLASLRAAGYVEGGKEAIRITQAGKVVLGDFEPLPTGRALQEYWLRTLDKAPSQFLRVICAAYPGTLSRAEAAIKADYSPDSRHVDNTLAQLRSRDLIRGPRAAIRASEELFS